MTTHKGDRRKTDWEAFLMEIQDLVGIKTKWPNQKISNAKPSKDMKRVLDKFSKSVYGVSELDYDRMFEMLTDEISNQGVREPAMVSWLTEHQKSEAVEEWKDSPIDINFIKSIPNPYTVKFNYPPPNVDYFKNQ